MRRSVARTSAVALGVAMVVVACTPPPTGDTGTTTSYTDVPTPPTVTSFSIKGGVNPAPSVVAFSWNVSDANLDVLTCALDGNGDGTYETTVPECNGTGTRNAQIAASGPVTARLRVSDGSTTPTVATLQFNVPSGSSEPFDIELRGVDDLDAPVAQAFESAVATWERVVTRGLPDYAPPPTPGCLPAGLDPLPALVDDMIVDVSTPEIDGPGGILGQAGPTCVLLSNELGFHGIMEFDAADVDEMLADGTLTDVITHELGHVLGIGTLWDMSWHPSGVRRLVNGRGGSNPTFVGPRAIAEWQQMGGAGNVPVENSGGPGTRDSHWRELTFGIELMTGYISAPGNPLSRMSIASMADMGYRVDLNQADAYAPPAGSLLRPLIGTPDGEMLRPPVGVA